MHCVAGNLTSSCQAHFSDFQYKSMLCRTAAGVGLPERTTSPSIHCGPGSHFRSPGLVQGVCDHGKGPIVNYISQNARRLFLDLFPVSLAVTPTAGTAESVHHCAGFASTPCPLTGLPGELHLPEASAAFYKTSGTYRKRPWLPY